MGKLRSIECLRKNREFARTKRGGIELKFPRFSKSGKIYFEILGEIVRFAYKNLIKITKKLCICLITSNSGLFEGKGKYNDKK